MAEIRAPGEIASVNELTLSAVIIRCGCGNPEAHRGQICPRPRKKENRGELAYWHPSLWRRLMRRLQRHFGA
jgi:hypothetical protein